MDWWEQSKLIHYESDDVKAHENSHIDLIFSPAQHWSARGVFDRNRSLWGGWIIISCEKRVYFAGDTGKWSFTGYTFI